ncbi:toprim domain-containing protein [[Mycoplasma] anseris]|uniref:Recombination protein RecR n=1 Tax=[Mycoplasma] anseris TaxID=92400 RepID=A0A2Z4NCL9_9BACT|nr:toprim domain-containing protein [[Mycoplasma] anseris]AWX69311.1 recombination protein RecR [[Mycoplasma] anseris]
MENQKIFELELILKKIPGFSKKQIQKIIDYLINSNKQEIDSLINAIQDFKENINKCEYCNNLLAYVKDCIICNDKNRDKKLLVVEQYRDIEKFEDLKIFNGYYFVLEGLYKLKNNDQNILNNIDKLLKIIDKYDEIILGLSATLEAQFCMQYLQKYIKSKYPKANVYQLSMGIPLGASVEYVDSITLKQSLINKLKM